MITRPNDLDFCQVRGNDAAVAACVRAVALHRPLVLVGPPGTGKTMIARRVPLIMDPLSDHERAWLEAEYTGTYEAHMPPGGVPSRPFRAPHHTVSAAALAGDPRWTRHTGPQCAGCLRAGRMHAHPFHQLPRHVVPRAAEIHLARFGVLMLDELGEFSKAAIDGLAHAMRTMHGAPLIIATTTPCPCGWLGQTVRECTCSKPSIARHQERSWTFMRVLGLSDTVHVAPISLDELRAAPTGPNNFDLRREVLALRSS